MITQGCAQLLLYCCHELTRNGGMLWAAQSNTELTQTRCHCAQGKAIGWSVSLT